MSRYGRYVEPAGLLTEAGDHVMYGSVIIKPVFINSWIRNCQTLNQAATINWEITKVVRKWDLEVATGVVSCFRPCEEVDLELTLSCWERLNTPASVMFSQHPTNRKPNQTHKPNQSMARTPTHWTFNGIDVSPVRDQAIIHRTRRLTFQSWEPTETRIWTVEDNAEATLWNVWVFWDLTKAVN